MLVTIHSHLYCRDTAQSAWVCFDENSSDDILNLASLSQRFLSIQEGSLFGYWTHGEPILSSLLLYLQKDKDCEEIKNLTVHYSLVAERHTNKQNIDYM